MKRHLILVGLPGSGKTTVGHLLAQRLGLPFADCDALVEKLAGMTIPQIFAQQGEAQFRRLEHQALLALCGDERQVIATGGGTVVGEKNQRLIKENGFVVFLDRDIEDIEEDVGNTERPLLKTHSLRELAEQRRAWYLACADAVVRGGTAEELAEKIAGWERR